MKSQYPYRRLVDPEIARTKPAATASLRRTTMAVFIVGTVAIVIAVGIIVCLVAFMYIVEPPLNLDGYRQSTPGPGSSAPGASTAEPPIDVGLLRDRLNSLELEVASLKLQCCSDDTLHDRGHQDEQSSEQIRSHLESTTEVQETVAETSEPFHPNAVPINTNHGVSGEQETLNSSPLTSHHEPSTLVTTWKELSAVTSNGIESNPVPYLSAQHRQTRSKSRRKAHQRRDRDKSTDDPIRRPVSGLERDRPVERGGRRAEAEPRRDRKKDRSSMNPRRGQRMSESSPDQERDNQDPTCRHCIDSDRINRDQGRAVDVDTFQAPVSFGRAAHIQGNRNGNIQINNEGWVRGPQTWKMADWTDNGGQYFSLNVLGTVTVQESGVYYVYSQVLFYDPNDTVGQSIFINDEPRFTCTKSNISAEAKQSTCYVGGVVRMFTGDTVRIKLSIPNVTIALYADTSYFGLFRVA